MTSIAAPVPARTPKARTGSLERQRRWALRGSYAALGRAYWFKVPNTGIAISLVAYVAGFVAAQN